MLNKHKIIQILKAEQSYLRDEYGVRKIAIFGSFAKEKAIQKSDIDIFIVFKVSPGMKFFDLVDFFEKKFKRKIDILTPKGLNSIRIKRVAQDIKRSLVYV